MLKVVGASWMKIRMSTWIIGIVLVLGIVVVILGQMGQLEQDGNYSATAYWNQETGFEIKFWGQGLDIETISAGVARAYFQPHVDTTGWAIIDIETQSEYPDWVQAYAAGMLEGSLSWQLIYWQWKNTVQNICANQKIFCNYVRTYLQENLESMRKMYEENDDPYWHQIYLFYIQLEGMKQGFEHGVKRSRQSIEYLKLIDFLWMNAVSDIVDLEYKFYDSKPYEAENSSDISDVFSDSMVLKNLRTFRSIDVYAAENRYFDEEKRRELVGCGVSLGSSLVKLLPFDGKLFVAHNTAGTYVSMLRMIKTYQFRYHRTAAEHITLENKLTFSSYPGAIHSMDDFYIISKNEDRAKIIILGTPITIFDKNLWKFVSPIGQVLSGLRTIVASRLSNSSNSWTAYLSRYNSGTGNKQWIVVDVEKFKSASKPRDGDDHNVEEDIAKEQRTFEAENVLWIAEQLPGFFIAKDQTAVLVQKTYWASYGLPFYENVTELSGTRRMQEKFGDVFSYTDCPLAKIYRRDHGKVHSLKSLMRLMRSNAYKHDPLSMGNPRCAIGARGDIPSELSYAFPIGVIDSKMVSVNGRIGRGDESFEEEEEEDYDDEEKDLDESSIGEPPADDGTRFLAISGPAHSLFPADKKETEEKEEEERRKGRTRSSKEETDGGSLNLDEGTLKPFNWAESLFTGFPHNGHPDNWDFKAVSLAF